MALVLQNVTFVILMRQSQQGDHKNYIPSTVVLLVEIAKVVISLVVLLGSGESINAVVKFVKDVPVREHLQMSVPAIVYMIQNNLYFVALRNLDAATFQVLAQLKIFTTGLFSLIILKRRLSGLKWLALSLLAAGVILAQLPEPSCTESSPEDMHNQSLSWLVGLTASVSIATLSGFAGVYTEKFLKRDPSRHVCYSQVQLAAFSVITNALAVVGKDGAAIRQRGFFSGYDSLTWALVFFSAGGGILVSVVVKFTSSLAKTYAVSFAIFVTALYNLLILGETVRASFWIAAFIVACSVVLYNRPDDAHASHGSQPSAKLDLRELRVMKSDAQLS